MSPSATSLLRIVPAVLACVTTVHAEDAWTSGSDMLRQVARYLDARTTRIEADGTRSVVVNEHNGWYYQTLLVLEGMDRLAAVLPEAPMIGYSDRRLAYVERYQNDPGLMSNRHAGFFYHWKELWCTGLAPMWFDRPAPGGRPADDPYVRRFITFLDACPRVDGGLLANVGTQVRTDDAYLMIPGMLRLGTIEKRGDRVIDGLQQMVGFHRRLFDPSGRLYRHIYDAKDGSYAAAYWGRGNGWMALAHVAVLAAIDPRPGNTYLLREEILGNFRAQMAGVRACQDPAGGWHQVLDHPESWIETSCTGMFVYAMARGVNEGWLEASYAEDARRGWKVLLGKIDAQGVSRDTCPGTGPGDLNHYLHRPSLRDDPHSYGPVLLAGAEMLRLEQRQPNAR